MCIGEYSRLQLHSIQWRRSGFEDRKSVRVDGSDCARHTHFWLLHTTLEQGASLIDVFFPDYIFSTALHHCCQAEPISAIAQRACWHLFGHILRLSASAPLNKAMMANYSKPGVGRRGRPQELRTLPIVLNEDLKCINTQIRTSTDLEALRAKAQTREEWRDMIERITRRQRWLAQ